MKTFNCNSKENAKIIAENQKSVEFRRNSSISPCLGINFFATLCLAACAILIAAVPAAAKINEASLSKETQMKLLQLKEARLLLQTSQEKLEESNRNLADMKELYEQDVVTGKEVSDAETESKDAKRSLELAKIDLAKTALSFLQDATHISILDAYQFIDAENSRKMSVTFVNDSNVELASLALGEGIPEANIYLKDIPGLMTIENLYVSIKSGATIISDPYEIKVPTLSLKEKKTLTFKLNTDSEQVALSMKYQNMETIHNIYLEKKSREDIVRVSSLKFAQEGQLGASVEFGLDLERLAEDEKTFTLGIIGLNDKYRSAYMDGGTQLSRVKFSQGSAKRSLSLRISVPDKLPDEELRQPIRFYVIVGEEDTVSALEDAARAGNPPTEDRMRAAKVGFEQLELTPRGAPEFEISMQTLYYEIKTGDVIETTITVKNTGSVRLDNIRFEVEKAYDWTVELSPEEIGSIEPRKETEVKAVIRPPEQVEVGAYEIKIEAETEYEGAAVKSDQKNMRVQVSATTNLALNLSIVGGLIFFILIIAVVTIRISRR